MGKRCPSASAHVNHRQSGCVRYYYVARLNPAPRVQPAAIEERMDSRSCVMPGFNARRVMASHGADLSSRRPAVFQRFETGGFVPFMKASFPCCRVWSRSAFADRAVVARRDCATRRLCPTSCCWRSWRNGRRRGLKIPFRKECGFESHRPHQFRGRGRVFHAKGDQVGPMGRAKPSPWIGRVTRRREGAKNTKGKAQLASSGGPVGS